jgi:RNase H-fold protein (predicted Holliday junction resolvase)
METVTKLGISLGSRMIGLAVMKYGELEEWQVKCFQDTWSKQKVVIICSAIKKIILHYQVSQVCIKIPQPVSRFVACVLHAIKRLLEKLGISFSELSLPELKSRFCEDRINKTQLAEKILTRFPFLQPLYEKEKKHTTMYYVKLFEAVAAVS